MMTDDDQRISATLSVIKDHYTVVVVGSGYGGAIAASRMARAGQSVCLLERGNEIRPGDYPATMQSVANQTRVTVNGNNPSGDGLFDLRVDDDVSVLVGCGLGGTSLINANVCLEADERVFLAEGWPQAFRHDPNPLQQYYELARQWLGATPYPDDYPKLRKLDALDVSARAIKRQAIRPPINVTFQPFPSGMNPFGVPQSPCVLCGDCVTGCNFGAKNTTLMNYLPDAKARGAEIFTLADVLRIEPDGPSWKVHVKDLDPNSKNPNKDDIVVGADLVILAAGTLGSTEILLRSAKSGLQVSARLGMGFSCNGDMVAWGYNNDFLPDSDGRGTHSALPFMIPSSLVNDADQRPEVYGVGAGARELSAEESPGPCIAGCIDMRDSEQLADSLVVQEGVIPGAFAPMLAPTFFFAAARSENFFEYADTSARLQDAQDVANAILNSPSQLPDAAYRGPVARTQSYLVMSHDSADGLLSLDQQTDRLRVAWPGAAGEKVYAHDEEILRKVNRAVRGNYIPNPISSEAFGQRVITVHPLGGCGMGDSGATGVVNDKCQVFRDTSDSKAVYDNLYVCDGSVMPGALGVNPLLTISAISERACDLMAKDRNWQIDLTTPILTTPVKAPERGNEPNKPPRVPWRDVRPRSVAAPAVSEVHESLGDIVGRIFRTGVEEAVSWLDSRMGFGASDATTLEPHDAVDPSDPMKAFKSILERDFMSDVDREIDAFATALMGLMSGRTSAMADLEAVVIKLANEFPDVFSPSLTFTERMAGFFSTQALPVPQPPALRVADPFEIARQYGAVSGDEMAAELTITAETLSDFTDSPTHEAKITGKVTCPALSKDDLIVANGTFALFPADPNRVETWNMVYSMDLGDGAERSYHFQGIKILHQKPGSSWWKDLTTLFVTVYRYDASGSSTTLFGRGIIELGLDDLVHQGRSVQLGNGKVLRDIAAAFSKQGWWPMAKPSFQKLADGLNLYFGARFAGFCAETVFKAYGGLLANLADFSSQEDASRARRSLNAPAPVVHSFLTADRVGLQLTRYYDEKNAANGPVILAPGFGVRASSFAVDTVDTNLVEFLTKDGFDVWLFDYRASPTLNERTPPFTIDDIALHDWAAAIDYVYATAGSKKPAVLAHCVGSMTLLMALLRDAGGIKDKVRSAICSQITLHPVTNWLNHLKSDLGVIGILEEYFGVTEVDLRSSPSAASKAMDTWLWSVPVPQGEECTNPVCRRVFAIYGPSYVHDRLNAETHIALREMFGKVHGKPFEQMARIVRKQRVVDSHGRDTYVTAANAKNLNLPLTFVAGARNQIFQPETSQLTLTWLRNVNPEWADQYQRHVFSDYAHMDFFIGKSAATDGVFKFFADTLKNR